MRKLAKLMLALLATACVFSAVVACDEPTPEPPAHEHTYATEWTTDATHHWHAATCEHTTEVKDKAEHTLTETVTLQPTYKAVGKAKKVCSCGYETAEYDVAKLATEDPVIETPVLLNSFAGKKLSEIVLEAGYAWVEGTDLNTVLEEGVYEDFKLTYTVPNDTEGKYNTLTDIAVVLTVAKMEPVVTAPTADGATYGDLLSTVALNHTPAQDDTEGSWAWKTPTAAVGNVGSHTHKAVFTPADTTSYASVERDITVTVAKAEPAYTVPTGLTATYGDTLADVTLASGWAWKLATTTSVGNAGNNEFVAVFTPSDTANYNTVEKTVQIAVAKADLVEGTDYTVPGGLTATYGDTLADVTLASGWAWKLATTTSVGNAGNSEFVVVFTPSDTANYNAVEKTVQIAVAKADPTLEFTGTSVIWSNNITLNDAWLGNSTDGATLAWEAGTAPVTTGSFGVIVSHPGSANYNARSETFDLTVNPDTTLANAYDWSAYSGNNPKAVTYDPLISKTYTWTGSDNFATGYAENIGYTKDFSTANEKGFDYKAILTDDGLYFVATAKHDVIRTGNADWSANTNIEAYLYNKSGAKQQAYVSVKSVNGTTVTATEASSMLTSYSVAITEVSGKNYKYETVFKGLIPTAYLTANNYIHDSGNALIHFGFRSGNESRIAVDIAGASYDAATGVETIPEGTYNYRTITSDSINAFAAGNTVTIYKDGEQWYQQVGASKNAANDRKIKLTIASKNVSNATGVENCYTFYVDYIDNNDAFYSLGAHTVAKPWIIYPKEYNLYGGGGKAAHVAGSGILWSQSATEAVIDGKADDNLWKSYKGGAIDIVEQRTDLLASAGAGAKLNGRSVKIKMVHTEKGIYVYAVARHSKYVDYMPAQNWQVFNTEFMLRFALTPDTDAWNNAVGAELSTTGADAYIDLGQIQFYPFGDGISNAESHMSTTKAAGDEYYTTVLEAFIKFEFFGGKYNGSADGYNLRVNAMFGSANEYAYMPGNTTAARNHWFNSLSHYADWSNIAPGTASGKYQKVPAWYHLEKNEGLKMFNRTHDYAVDGDLSDWASYGGITQHFVDSANSKKYVKYRAILTADGIYLASEAVAQSYYLYGGNSLSGTQMSIILNHSSNINYTASLIRNNWVSRNGAATAGVTQYYEVATSVTEVETGYYKVVFEVFIPNATWKARVGNTPSEITPLLALNFGINTDSGTDNFFYSAEYAALGNTNGRNWTASNKEVTAPMYLASANKDGKMYVTANGFSLTDPLATA